MWARGRPPPRPQEGILSAAWTEGAEGEEWRSEESVVAEGTGTALLTAPHPDPIGCAVEYGVRNRRWCDGKGRSDP